ncbi:SMEK domain-containing protein [Algoriphagus confluentis]|uniref:NACHT domain-containing NTPase n=1 Tax=Algoriphagus confluentis TaxID=1697556 RepID=A0ABQ6PRP1_9BACT|nr:NACHT domain-containing NTPase [Algoriphagus confluentis]
MDSSEKLRAKLLESFAGISSYIYKSNRKENSNINHFIERYLTSIFQVLFPDQKFRLLESDRPNAAKIDIISENESFGIQVTVDTSVEKIRSTLQDIKKYWPNIQKLILVYPTNQKPKRRQSYGLKGGEFLEWSFNEIEKEIWEKGRDSQAEIQKISNVFFPNLAKAHLTLENIELIEFESFIKTLNQSDKYLPRKVTKKEPRKDTLELEKTDLYDLLLKERKVVLTGEPGLGKTYELIDVAKKIATNKKAYPIFLELKDCVSKKEFENYLPENHQFIPEKKLVLILDGFDEISIKEKDSIIQNLNTFLKSKPEIMILISVRANFYSSILEGKLPGFCEASLNSFDWEDIGNYVFTFYGIDREDFISSCYSHSLLELAENPYYLNLLAIEYLAENGLHGSSSEILKSLFERRIEYDLNEHFSSSIPDKVAKEDIQDILEKISCIMTIGGYSNIPHKEIKKIVPNDQLELLKQLLIFKPSSNESSGQWLFEHNKIRDFLSAKSLSKQEYTSIKKLVCVPGTNLIAPNWFDTLILLLNIIPNSNPIFQPISRLILENNTIAIFNIERGKFSPKLRFQVLKQLVEYYKIRTIWIKLNGVSESRIAYFSQSDESFEYLVSEINNSSGHRRHRLSCLFILKEFKNLNSREKERIKSVFFPIMEKNQKDEHLSQYFIESLARLQIIDFESITFVKRLYRVRNNQFIRGGMYEFIASLESPDDWIDYLLEGLLIERNSDPDRSDVGNGSESISLESAFKSIRLPSTLNRILEEFTNNEKYEHNFRFDKILEITLIKAIDFYNEFPKLFKLVITLNSKLVSTWRHEYYQVFQEYFRRTNSFQKGFNEVMKKCGSNLDYQSKEELSNFIDNSSMIDFNKYFDLGKISFEDSEVIFFKLRNLGNKFHEEFKRNLEIKSGRKIVIPKPTDSKQLHVNRKKKDLEVWFNKDGLKNEINEIIGREEELTLKNLSKSIFEGNLANSQQLNLHHTAKKVIRQVLSSGLTSKLEIWKWVNNDEEFETFLIGRIHDLIHRQDPFELLDDNQLSYLLDWFQKNIETIDFRLVRIFGEEVNMYNLHRAKYISFLYEKLFFPCSKDKALEMLAFCNNTHGSYETVTISTIIRRIGKKEVEDQIERNILTKAIQNSMALRSHFNYAFKNKMEHLFNSIFDNITNENITDKTRLSDLNEFFVANNDPKYLYPYFQKFSENDQLFILEKIQNDYLNADLDSFLENLTLNDNSIEIERAINSLLLRQGKVEGLVNSIDWIKKNKINPFNYKNFELVNFTTLEALPYLLELLVLSYDKEISNNVRIDTIWGKVRIALIELAKKSPNFAENIIMDMEKLIQENPVNIEDIGHNYEIIEDIKDDVLQEKLKPQSLTIKKCIKIYNNLF